MRNNKTIAFYAVILALLIMWAITVCAQDCASCPKEKPCGYTVPAGDGCNTCSGESWCIDGKWYTDGAALCTLKTCIKTSEIENPFERGNAQK